MWQIGLGGVDAAYSSGYSCSCCWDDSECQHVDMHEILRGSGWNGMAGGIS